MTAGSQGPGAWRAPEVGVRAARGLLMTRLTIRCPVTGTPVDTGFELSSLPEVSARHLLIDCTECGQDHPWRVEDAFVD